MLPLNILGLDLGGTTGFAYGPPKSKPVSGTIRIDSKWPQGRRFVTLEGRVRNLISVYEITHLIVEAPYIQTDPKKFDIKVVEMGYGYRAAVRMAAEKEGIGPENISTVTSDQWRNGTLRVSRAPYGTPNNREWLKKKAVMACDERRWPIHSEDEAEACLIWEHGCEIIQPASTLNRLPLFDQVTL